MGEVIHQAGVNGGLIEVLRLPCGQLAYRSTATGYSIYSETPERAGEALGWLQGRI